MGTSQPLRCVGGRPARYGAAGRLQGWNGSPAGSSDSPRARGAETLNHGSAWPGVGKASRRFMYIDEHGNEVPDEWVDRHYTPNHVSDPYLFPDGVAVYVDTQGFLTVPMGQALLRELVGELHRLPFDTRVRAIEQTRQRSGGDLRTWSEANSRMRRATLARGSIARAVRCVVHHGVPDVTIEYLDSQGGWTTARADARVHQPDEHGTHRQTWRIAERLTLSIFEEA